MFKKENSFSLIYLLKLISKNWYPMIKSVQRGLELNGTHQLLLCADDANILGRSTHTMKKNIEALVVASKEIDPEVHAEKTK